MATPPGKAGDSVTGGHQKRPKHRHRREHSMTDTDDVRDDDPKLLEIEEVLRRQTPDASDDLIRRAARSALLTLYRRGATP